MNTRTESMSFTCQLLQDCFTLWGKGDGGGRRLLVQYNGYNSWPTLLKDKSLLHVTFFISCVGKEGREGGECCLNHLVKMAIQYPITQRYNLLSPLHLIFLSFHFVGKGDCC